MKTGKYILDSIGDVIFNLLPIILLIGYSFPLFSLASQRMNEKEFKLKAYMKIMGMNEITYLL